MKEHNGTVEAANAQDGGAVFTVTLPLAGVNSGTPL
jgi:signal transduction histidine kinase